MDRRTFLASAAAVVSLAPAARAQGSEDAKLRALLDRMFEAQVDDSPESATALGVDTGRRAGLRARLDDNSLAGKARRLERSRGWLAELRAIDRTRLTTPAKIDLDVVTYHEERTVHSGDRYKFGDVGRNYSPYVVSQRTGVYQDIPDFMDSQHRVATAADADAWLSRLSAFAGQLDSDLERLRHDAGLGVIPPEFVVPTTLGQLKALRDQPAEQTVMVTSLETKAKAVGLAADYGAKAAAIVRTQVFPALDRQIAHFETLAGRTKGDVGVWALPDGEAYYADGLKNSTTANYSPEEVHQMGLSQAAEIEARIDAIFRAQGMTQGTVGERMAALTNDARQTIPNTDEGRALILRLLNEQTAACYALLPKAFRTLPKAKVEIRRVPEFIQDGASNGYYQSPTLDGSRPGAFYINLKDTAEWPRYNLPTLVYHEAVPGHHLQIAIAQESGSIPLLRRVGYGSSAYSEGWGLYAEQLADEMGVYANDPFGQIGYLQALLFRAARLVVDTGIHSKRWSRRQATDYMVAILGQARSRLEREVDRYFVSPGQACSYKVGHTVWVKVREDARRAMGARFDLRDFHDAGLLSGNMPLTVLERRIAEWSAGG